jgi:hypothetical protein
VAAWRRGVQHYPNGIEAEERPTEVRQSSEAF